jgi:2-polyprenyl-3-methyl-5-hydroxy-6-metoxy-1,4-benzoquinol methylase
MADFFDLVLQIIRVDFFIAFGLYSILYAIVTLFYRNPAIDAFDRSASQLIRWIAWLFLLAVIIYSIALYSSGTLQEKQMLLLRISGPYAFAYWTRPLSWIVFTQLLRIQKVRRNKLIRLFLSICMIVSFEQYVIIVTSLHRDYLPGGWSMSFTPTEFISGILLKIVFWMAIVALFMAISIRIKRFQDRKKSKKAVAIFDKLAMHYQNKYMNVDLYADGLDRFCDALAPNASVLELACGPGNVTRYLLDKRPDLQILGTDLAPKMIALARTNNPEARFEIMDCRDIAQLQQQYDGVVCAFCLPYLSREETVRLIADSAKKLNPGGLIYISTIEDNYAKSGWKTGSTGDQMYQYFYEGDDLVDILKANGFEVVHIDRIVYQSGETPVTDLILIARKS